MHPVETRGIIPQMQETSPATVTRPGLFGRLAIALGIGVFTFGFFVIGLFIPIIGWAFDAGLVVLWIVLLIGAIVPLFIRRAGRIYERVTGDCPHCRKAIRASAWKPIQCRFCGRRMVVRDGMLEVV